MFFKMLKSDLKQKKGLNVVLFLFITVASILVFVGSVQVYQFCTANDRSKEVCNISDALMFCGASGAKQATYRKGAEEVLDENSHVTGYYRKEMLEYYVDNIEFNYFKSDDSEAFKNASHYFMTLPEKSDLLFDLDDKPFYVPNGSVYLAEDLRLITGAQVGDKMKLTSQMGNIYEFEIAGFYKQPYLGSFKWYIISEADYKVLSEESFINVDMYGLKLDEASYFVADKLLQDMVKKTPVISVRMQDLNMSDDYVMDYVISIFMVLISIFLMLIIIMTIRFTMIAALKDEEREIGMMRAMGVDSLSFRWIFAAKYIAFAVIGGMIGIIVGFPLSKSVLLMFGASKIQPDDGTICLIGLISVVFIIAIMIAFSLIVMRRINKISVINAIRGENRTERFGKSSVMFLHKRKSMSVPAYLAASDILKRFKRYLFLFIAYTLGVLVMLLTVNLKSSVISTDFMRYYMIYQMDFSLNFDKNSIEPYYNRALAENKDIWQIINEDIEKAGIPAHIDADHYLATGQLLLGEKEDTQINMNIYYGEGDVSRLQYRDGGAVPVKKNEAALSYYTASNLGIQLGDTITLSLPSRSPNGLTETTKKEKFIVTAYVDTMEAGMPSAILGAEFKNPIDSRTWMAMIIDAEGAEKEEAFTKLQNLFGENVVSDGDEYVRRMMFEYDELFTLLEYVMGGAVIFILLLMTYLYSSIFIAEEKSEIALQKSMGFTDGTIKAAHILRILILSVVSVVLGEILLRTFGQWFVGEMMGMLGLTGFGFLPEYILSFGLIPLIVIGTVLITQWMNLKAVKNIAVWNITDE